MLSGAASCSASSSSSSLSLAASARELGKTDDPAAIDRQGLKLVHFSAQRKSFLWHRGCI